MPFVATGENLKEDVSVKDGLCLGLVLLPTVGNLEVDVKVRNGLCFGLVLLSIHQVEVVLNKVMFCFRGNNSGSGLEFIEVVKTRYDKDSRSL